MATENRLLAVLPRQVYEKLTPKLKRVSLDEFINMGQRIRQGAELPYSTPIVVTAEH